MSGSGIGDPGRSCPTYYRYRASDLSSAALIAGTLYVAGGLYGNVCALEEIVAMAEQESSGPVTLVFNGDFNWLNVNPADFRMINESVLAYRAIQGNVEAELAAIHSGAGCGCAYPSYVDDVVVKRSNSIIERLRATSRRFPELVDRLSSLPRHLTVDMGDDLVGILHGDPESLAGWRFALEAMEPPDNALRRELKCKNIPTTTARQVGAWFREAGVGTFACSHTGLPFAQDFLVNGRAHLVINNGSAGLANFQGETYGVITRISLDVRPPSDSLYGITMNALRYDAVPVRFNIDRWLARFLDQWPPGSPAHDSYMWRIIRGTNLRIDQATRGEVGVG